MIDDEVTALRRFNRTVTERIGVLNDAYLARGRPLGASRVLWEIGLDGSDVRTLRRRLDLDSGYLSRLLRRLETEHLVTVTPDPDDSRARVARLTGAGIAERELLDRRSDDLVRSLLEPLSAGQRTRLVEAATTVERLLTAGLVDIRAEDPTSEAARFCLGEYFRELDARFETGFDPAASISADPEELVEPAGLLLIARLRGTPVGCGALKFHRDAPAELKRMWVAPDTRGLGLGRRILTALEHQAAGHDAEVVRLETNASLVEAIGLYRSSGYREVAAFNREPFADHWFEKELGRT
ncbi:MAG: helix-turn-helix domain-containing GNAT family N-acetyltransferase [Acidimicrobiia bacterium]|jgi:DNA-binding MarR family transcriptional regulator/GNAT superfamily N-acetyltransferase